MRDHDPSSRVIFARERERESEATRLVALARQSSRTWQRAPRPPHTFRHLATAPSPANFASVNSKDKPDPKRSLTPREVAVIRKIDAEIARVLADRETRNEPSSFGEQKDPTPVTAEFERQVEDGGTSTNRDDP